ncbi:MAG: hypothetical protein LBN20_04785 [Endomicrobium sp.]|jgi:hypothetical protein|nr:hypothetical protein [Endomicrobium sp.]
MKLIKKGFIYNTDKKWDWSVFGARAGCVDIIDKNVWRIYYNARDANNESHPSYIEVEAGNPQKILYIHNKPILDLGQIGTFDDCGIGSCSIINYNGKKYLYYLGFSVKKKAPFFNQIGLAISEDGGKTFHKFGEGPVLGQTYRIPYSFGGMYAACVCGGEGVVHGYCPVIIKWHLVNGRPESIYNIRYFESTNGIDWEDKQIVAVDFKNDREEGLVWPSVIKEKDFYRMWYSFRGGVDFRDKKQNAYKIGYAESKDGKVFKRMDDIVGIEPDNDENAWDSIMQCYPTVIKYNDLYWVFYSGNGFGSSGFGYACFEEEKWKIKS